MSVRPDLGAMLSIRFKGLDRQQPFVEALTSRTWTAGDLIALVEAAQDTYGAFRPLHLRLWSAQTPQGTPKLMPDKRALAAPIQDLRLAPVPPELTLTPTTDLGQYAAAQAAYAAVDQQHPHHAAQAGLLSEEDLQACIQAGTMFDVRLHGSWVGYVGALAKPKLGLSAYSVQELLLTPQARGRAYGQALTTLLARHLPEPQRMLVGTIAAGNQGALQVARRAGRIDIGGWDFLSLARP